MLLIDVRFSILSALLLWAAVIGTAILLWGLVFRRPTHALRITAWATAALWVAGTLVPLTT